MKLITFIDSIGRAILAEESKSTDKVLTVKNPVMINVNQQQNGQLQVQLIPLFFGEFVDQATRSEGTLWSYQKSSIATGEVNIDSRLQEQYTRIFTVTPSAPEASGESVIKLFDE
jgi:hypothetical protein